MRKYSRNIIDLLVIVLLSIIPDSLFILFNEYIMANLAFVGLYLFIIFIILILFLYKYYYELKFNHIMFIYLNIILIGLFLGIIERNNFKYLIQNFSVGLGGILSFFWGRILFKKYKESFVYIFISVMKHSLSILGFIMILFYILKQDVLHFSNIRYFPLGISFCFFYFFKDKNIIHLIEMVIMIFSILLTLKRSLLIYTLLFIIISLKYCFKDYSKRILYSLIFIIIVFLISMSGNIFYKLSLLERFKEFLSKDVKDLFVLFYANNYFMSYFNRSFIKIILGNGAGALIPFEDPFYNRQLESNFIDNLYATTITKYGLFGVIINYVLMFWLLIRIYKIKDDIFLEFSFFKSVMYVFLLLYLFSSWISSWFFYSYSALLFWLFLGFLYESSFTKRDK